MKEINRILVSAAVATVLLNFNVAFAQDSKAWRLGLGGNVGTGIRDPFGVVLGVDAKLQKDLKGPVSVTLAAGYSRFSVNDEYKNFGVTYNVIPLKAGLKVFANKHLYLSGEVGAGFTTNYKTSTSFVWSPSIGWAFTNGLDLGIKYEDYTKFHTTKQVAFRIAYGFKLSK